MMEEEFSFFNDVEELIEKEAWKFVFLLRFSPIPFGILNMILAVSFPPEFSWEVLTPFEKFSRQK